MLSPFDAAFAKVSASLTRTFGKAATFVPMVERQYRGFVADPSRPAITVRAEFTAIPALVELSTMRNGSDWIGNSALQGVVARLWISAAERAAIPYEPKAGDRIEIAGRPHHVIVGPPAISDAGDHAYMLALEGHS